MTDNGPQFSSAEFSTFTRTWSFDHTTSSPHYPQSNGKAENAVKTVKRLFTKCKEAGRSEYRALLDWRNTPTEGMGTSPAQRFLGRRCKTLLPITHLQLQPRYPTADDSRALQGQKAKQQYYYDRCAKDLPPISRGDTIRMRLPGESTWTPGVCTRQCGPRSYGIRVGDREFRRNRRQLLLTGERPPPQDIPSMEIEEAPFTDDGTTPATQVPDVETPAEPESPSRSDNSPVSVSAERDRHMLQPLRRSERTRKSPDLDHEVCSILILYTHALLYGVSSPTTIIKSCRRVKKKERKKKHFFSYYVMLYGKGDVTSIMLM